MPFAIKLTTQNTRITHH